MDEESYQNMAHWAPVAGRMLTVSFVQAEANSLHCFLLRNSDFKLDGHTVDLHFMVNDFFMPLGWSCLDC